VLTISQNNIQRFPATLARALTNLRELWYRLHPTAFERRGNNLKRFQAIYLDAKARIWL